MTPGQYPCPMPGIPHDQSELTAHALLRELVFEKFAYYANCCEGALENVGSVDTLWQIYNSTLKRSYLPIAFLASRLKNIEEFIKRLLQWTRDWLHKSQSKPQELFDSFLSISSGISIKTPLASCFFACHLSDLLTMCPPKESLVALSLEHFFAFLQYMI
jgi:hypothetical protein